MGAGKINTVDKSTTLNANAYLVVFGKPYFLRIRNTGNGSVEYADLIVYYKSPHTNAVFPECSFQRNTTGNRTARYIGPLCSVKTKCAVLVINTGKGGVIQVAVKEVCAEKRCLLGLCKDRCQ